MNMSTSQARVVDPILTNHSRGYRQAGLIGGELLPIATCRPAPPSGSSSAARLSAATRPGVRRAPASPR
jgi:hypothetical protein